MRNLALSKDTQRVILLILDGWGISPAISGNAIAKANTPNFNLYLKNYPHTTLSAAGEEVGLTWGEVGNSEVGHLNIGGGRVVWQYLAQVNHAILDNSFFVNKALVGIVKSAKKSRKNLHLIGLASSGGVHSHIDHLIALLSLIKRHGGPTTYLHLFTDGRDSSPEAAKDDFKHIQNRISEMKIGKIATICGRYFAMDRDRRWDRTEVAYNAITSGEGTLAGNPINAIKKAYLEGNSDEFITPIVIGDKKGKPIGSVSDGDSMIFFNFRSDRIIQLVRAFSEDEFTGFNRKFFFPSLQITSFTHYHRSFNFPTAFPPREIKHCLPEVIYSQGMPQLHIAETEKYAHVTYFLNGGKEKAYPSEDRILIPSPRVATYDEKPEMSANEIAKKTCENVAKEKYPFIIINIANPDMVGHTGEFDACVKAVETTDETLGKIVKCGLDHQYFIMVTADHGNVEEVRDQITGRVSKDHTTNPVPLLLIGPGLKRSDRDQARNYAELSPVGVLADIAPTVLELLKINKPKEMTGYSLLPILL